MANRLPNGMDARRFWPIAFGLLIALCAAQPVNAAQQALLVCTVVQTPTQDNTNTAVKILNNCCNLAQGTKIAVTVGQTGVAPQALMLTLEKPLMRHQTAVLGFYTSVPRASWCSANRS